MAVQLLAFALTYFLKKNASAKLIHNMSHHVIFNVHNILKMTANRFAAPVQVAYCETALN